ncbi:TPA: DUF1542 domain-containing protein, partial [Streptococcus suis]|nr:DUF1542 domain-containing protein [Streptococcus suis]
MSSKDMFRKEQRFSFRKFSFGLASAVIANVIFGGAIASSPVVHANTTTETAAVATSERTASLSYTVNIVDQAGKVVDTQTKTVSVKTTEATASTTAYLTTDLVPTGYALVSGLGQVTVTENATNVFTVQVEEIASEAASTAASESATSTTAVSESATATSEVAASETATSESATATSEVAASATATTASATSATKAERTAYLSYVTQYVNEEKEIVDSKGHLVAVTTTDETAKTQVTVSASENMPAGYELAQEKAEVVLQLVENQANVLAFAVAKKSEEEEIAESQLSNRDVLTQVTSEADLLADEALRQVAGEQAGNTALETAANDTKAAAAAANQVLANAAATEAELGAQIDTVRTSTQNLAAEMLKVDADGVLTAQLNTVTGSAANTPTTGTNKQPLYVFNKTAIKTVDEGTKVKVVTLEDPDGINSVAVTRETDVNTGVFNPASIGITIDTDGNASGTPSVGAIGVYSRGLTVTDGTGATTNLFPRNNELNTFVLDTNVGDPIKKKVGESVTEDEILEKVTVSTGNSNTADAAIDTRYRKELAPGQTIPTTPGTHTVNVRVITASNVYKDVPVTVIINGAPTMPTIGVNSGVAAKVGDNRQLEVLHVFGNVTGTTEAVSTSGSGTAPDFDTAKATKSFLATDPENEAVTLTYGVPGNITAYEAGNPDSLTTNGNPPISAETGDLGKENSNQLLFNDQGRLTGEFPYAPGGLYSRIIKMTDTAGNVSYSNPFFVVAYTDKRADNTDLTVATASDLTEANIFGKLKIDTTSGAPGTNQSLTVPESEYTRTIVGYRTVDGTTKGELVEQTDLTQFPAGKNYEIKVATTNPYGQTIYNWVPVNDSRTAGTDKKPLYVFNNTPIATVGAGTDEADNVNKVKVVTLEDPDGINSVEVTRETDVNTGIFTPGDIGITIDKDGNASGTPKVGPIGVYSRGLTVTDGKGATTNLFPRNDEMQTYVLDATAGPTITKAAGETVTEAEILDNVTINTGNSNTMDAAIDSRYRKVLAPGQTVPTAPGEYDVKVRVITESNVYKDVTVKVIIPKYSDTLTATATENTSLIPGSGTAVSQPIAITKAADGSTTTAPAGTTYEIDPAFKAEKEALGYEISVSPTGEVSVKAPAGQEADITVPVTVTYPDKTTDSVSVPFKVDQKGLAQLKATEALDEKATAAKEAIDNNPNLSDAEKQAAKDAVDADTEKAKQAVADATTIDEVDAAKEAGTTNVDGKVLDAAKQDAKNKIAEDVTAAKEAIDNNPNLSEDEKQAAKDAVDAEAEKANQAIDAATTPEAAQTAEESGTAAIAADVLDAAKLDAKNKIAEDVTAAKEAIDNNPNLSEAEKKAAKDAVDAEAEKANQAIDAATTPEAAQTAEESGTAAIAEDVLDAAKLDAKNKIAEDVTAAKEAIDNNPNLSEDEKQAAKDAVDAEAEKANQAIDAATTPEAVQAAEEAGTEAIAEDVLDAAKLDAKNKIAKDVEAANAAIESNPNLSEDEKQAAKDAVDAEAEKANQAIDAATTPEAAQTAEEAGTAAIAEDVLDAAKLDAKNKIAKDLATVEAAIDANSNLSEDEKKAAKLEAQAKAAEAVANIEKATTPEAVQTLEDAAVKELANIEIKAAYDDAVKAIEAADNLSTAAKTQALEDLKKARQAAEDAIKTATTADEVATAALEGVKSLAKVEAKAAADDAKAAIAQNSNLTDAEKKVYTDAIDEALKDTETKIDAATDADTVDAETVLAQKDIAKQEVAAATADAVKGIEANTNLTDAEKDEYKAAVTKAAETAEKAIEDATTAADIQSKTFDATQDVAKEEVKADAADAIAGIKANDNLSDTAKEEAIAAIEEARDTTLENIENAKTAAEVDTATLDAEKANAKAEIKAAADDAKKAIDENANLPESDKTALKLAIDAEVAATNLEIDNAKTAEEIDAATLATEKSIAKTEVKAAAEDALRAIDENANLTDDEKAAAKADVYVELSKAEKAIDKATTADAIDNATLVGEKAFATAELEAAAEDAKKAIDANTHLTDDQKQAAKDAVDAELAKAKEAVAGAVTADEVDAATLVGEKAVAKEEIKAAAEDAKKAIDANSNLTDEEKAAAKAAVDTEVAKANDAIDAATTADAVDAATLVGEKAVAKEELKAAAEDAKKAIDENANLTPEEKQAAKDAVDAEVAKAEEAIDAATTADAVDAATLVGEKAVAKEELKAAAEDAKAAIDANDNLTDAEKQAAKDAVDAEVAKAEEAIDAATTADEVDAATLVGEKAVAKEELKAAAEDAKAA